MQFKGRYVANSTVGQIVKYTVIKEDVTRIEILNSGNIRILINGVSYRAEYTSAEALNAFANNIME